MTTFKAPKAAPPRARPQGAGKSSFGLIDAGAFFETIRLRRGSSFLDIASGPGHYTLAAAEVVGPRGALYAIDLWKDGIARLREEAAVRRIKNVFARVANVGKRFPLADGSVDTALMATVLHDLVEEGIAEKALRETARVLRPGGRFAIVEFRKIDGPPGPPKEVRLDRSQVEKLVEPFGFRALETRGLGPETYLVVFRRVRYKAG